MSVPISGSPKDIPWVQSQSAASTNVPLLRLEEQIKGKSWDARGIDILERWDIQLEEKWSNNFVHIDSVQKQIDKFGEKIENLIHQSKELTRWIDHHDSKEWYKQLGHFVATLPIKAVRNILTMVYSIIKGTVYAFVHPIKFANQAAQMLIRFIVMLGTPEFYTKLGTGMIGASLGNLAVMGGMSPPALIGLGLGGAFLLGGLTAGAIKAALANKPDASSSVKTYLWNELKTLPEVLLTSFLLGALIGGIQKATTPQPAQIKYLPEQAKAGDPNLLNLPNPEINQPDIFNKVNNITGAPVNANDIQQQINDMLNNPTTTIGSMVKNMKGEDIPTMYVATDRSILVRELLKNFYS